MTVFQSAEPGLLHVGSLLGCCRHSQHLARMGTVVIRAFLRKDSAHTVAPASTSTAMAAMLYGMAVIDDKGPWDER